MTEQQVAELAKLHADKAVAWLVIYEDGSSTILRDDTRSMIHAAGAHGVRVALTPQLANEIQPVR